MNGQASEVTSIAWCGDSNGFLRLLDQTRLPASIEYVDCRTLESVWESIRSLRVRGAPAIGIAAAYGVCVGLQARGDVRADVGAVIERLASSRPTAVNLFWALRRMERVVANSSPQATDAELRQSLWHEAQQIHDEDRRLCHAIGQHGAELLEDGWSVLTHCNTGGLATSEYGTALSMIFTAQDQGKRLHVFVDETRPLFQGARLTAWELVQRQVPATLICDSMAAQVMREGRVQAVLVGADRIAANGDTANKIGTYGLAILAAAHGIPFYVAAPSTTIDMTVDSGDEIPIEQRSAAEITHPSGVATAAPGIGVYNPAFDVTPARYLHAIVTERGTIRPVTREQMERHAGDTRQVPAPHVHDRNRRASADDEGAKRTC